MAFGKFDHLTTKPVEATAPVKPTEKPVVLIVDDDVRVLEGLELNLRDIYTVRTCSNPNEVINYLDQTVRVVILDIKMPGKSGFDVYKELKAIFSDLPIIFYSAYQNALEGARLSKEYRPFNYFDKSGNINELLASIGRAVEHYEQILKLTDITSRMQRITGNGS